MFWMPDSLGEGGGEGQEGAEKTGGRGGGQGRRGKGEPFPVFPMAALPVEFFAAGKDCVNKTLCITLQSQQVYSVRKHKKHKNRFAKYKLNSPRVAIEIRSASI